MPGRRPLGHQALLLALVLAWPPAARADDAAALKRSGCAAIAAELDQAAPAGPVFIASYPAEQAGGIPALRQTAFVYDNALAAIALIACADTARAERILAAFRIAAANDRYWHDGRLRNAYRAGPVAPGTPPALPGWWNPAARRWNEDVYQTSTATGNVAWAALALLAHPTPDNRAAAIRLMRWVLQATSADGPYPGFAGGTFGEEPAPAWLHWQSTEHNVDVAAAFHLLAGTDPAFAPAAARARTFVASMWDPVQGRFWLGTSADGRTINRSGSGIDAELWPLIGIADTPAGWQRAKNWVRAHHATGGGFGFRDAAAGLWTEGTAQAALVLPDPTLSTVLLAQRAPDGLLYATADARIRTGLALTPSSATDDFYYFHLPHLGATAWSVLAATGVNPFAPASMAR